MSTNPAQSMNNLFTLKLLFKKNTTTPTPSRIIITITHKLSNFEDNDRIILLKNGKIISSGNEKYLLENSSLYQVLKKYYRGRY